MEDPIPAPVQSILYKKPLWETTTIARIENRECKNPIIITDLI